MGINIGIVVTAEVAGALHKSLLAALCPSTESTVPDWLGGYDMIVDEVPALGQLVLWKTLLGSAISHYFSHGIPPCFD